MRFRRFPILAISTLLAFNGAGTSLVAQHDGPSGGAAGEPVLPLAPGPEIVDTSELAVPNAREIVGDVQSVMFWSRFQRGEVGAVSYVLFPDGSANVMQDNGRNEAAYRLTCTLGERCVVSGADGSSFTVPAVYGRQPDIAEVTDGESLSRYLADWILEGTGSPPPAPEESGNTIRSAEQPEQDAGRIEAAVGKGNDTNAVLDTTEAEASADASRQERRRALAVSDNAASSTCIELPGFLPSDCASNAVFPITPRTAQGQGAGPGPTETDAGSAGEAEPPHSFAERTDLRCFATGTFSLQYTDPDTGATGPGKPRVSFGCSGRITDRLSLLFVLKRYADPEQQEPWDPDFTYAFTYRITDRFNLTFSNYLARFDGPSGEGDTLDSLRDGKLRANYKLPRVDLPIVEDLACVVGAGVPELLEERFSLSCGLGITDKLRLGGSAYYYLPGQQDTYEPDFSYTISYRINDRFRITYSNYSNNRWFGNQGDAPGPGFVGGSLSLTHSFRF